MKDCATAKTQRTTVLVFCVLVFHQIQPIHKNELQDILLCNERTTGLVVQNFVVNGSGVRIVDMGGQRSERKKWAFCIDNATIIMFVVDLSCYDAVLYEDHSQNAMYEALEVFRVTTNDWFPDILVVLVFNKVDLFEKKIQRVYIGDYFPDFESKRPCQLNECLCVK